jgi:hypothetical protein
MVSEIETIIQQRIAEVNEKLVWLEQYYHQPGN